MYHRASKDAHEWKEEDFVVADDGEDGDFFGGAVAVSGGILIVGAKFNSEIMDKAGAAYAYQRAVTVNNDGSWYMGWNQLEKLVPETLLSQDYFGCSVAIHKNITVIGAYGRDDGGTFAGAVFVYHVYFDEYGVVEFEYDEIVRPESQYRYDWFGISVAIHDQFLLVGAPGVDYNGKDRSGAAYIFTTKSSKDAEDGYIWVEKEQLVVSDGGKDDRFGEIRYAVSLVIFPDRKYFLLQVNLLLSPAILLWLVLQVVLMVVMRILELHSYLLTEIGCGSTVIH